MLRYLGHERLSAADIAVIRAYLVQWIDAPVWDTNPHLDGVGREELKELRLAARRVDSRSAINEWVEVAADWGLDPV